LALAARWKTRTTVADSPTSGSRRTSWPVRRDICSNLELNWILRTARFDNFVKECCAKVYGAKGRPGIPPGVYTRVPLGGFFEGSDSEPGIALRCAYSLSLGGFLGYSMPTPGKACKRLQQRAVPSGVNGAADRQPFNSQVRATLS